MNIVSAQLLSLFCIFVCMIAVFLLPYWWMARKPNSFGGSRYQTAISFANCLSGGVFIATFFIGLMPEVRLMFEEVFVSYEIASDFPITEFVIFIGFLLALGIEQSVLEYKEKKGSYSSVPSGIHDENSKSELNPAPVTCSLRSNNSLDYDSDSPTVKVCNGRLDNESILESPEKFHNHNHGHSHDIGSILEGETNIRLGMLMVSLGIHSLFEGLALGLQTSVSTLINLVIGVAVHELLVAFAMGVNVSRLRLPISTSIKLALFFSASIPVGQLLGLIIGRYQSTAAIAVSASLQGLAAGTFIHVTFLEVIPAEFHISGSRLLKVLFLGLGFMALLFCNIIMKDFSHEHS